MTRLTATKVIACPNCEQLALTRGVASFNTGDLTRWSDGYVDSWFKQPAFTRCVACREVFWIEDAIYVGDFPPETPPVSKRRPKWLSWFIDPEEPQPSWLESIPDSWKFARPVENADIATVDFGVEALKGVTTANEQRLRRLLWWKLNDPHRNPGRPMSPAIAAAREKYEAINMLRLLELSENSGLPTIESVEILRELGRFDEARAVLGRINQDTLGIDILGRKIDDRDCQVCVLQEPSWHRS